MRFAHTNIVARDWKSLAEFYISVFECRIEPPQRKQSGAWLEHGTGVPNPALEGVHLRLPGYGEDGPTLEIFTYSEVETLGPSPANRQGLRHIAFEVDDVRKVVACLLEAGGRLEGQVVERDVEGVGKLTFVYARDPEGNIIEIQSWKKQGEGIALSSTWK